MRVQVVPKTHGRETATLWRPRTKTFHAHVKKDVLRSNGWSLELRVDRDWRNRLVIG